MKPTFITSVIVASMLALPALADEAAKSENKVQESASKASDQAPQKSCCKQDDKLGKKVLNRLTIGGYGEAVYSRNFYSDNVYRYAKPAEYKNDPSHGRFDIPHAVIYLGYNFGKGWRMQSEIEFEHGGAGSASEQEYEEAGEWESEIERGGEVELEQFWIEKSFMPQLNVRFGHIVVPVGQLNFEHEPLNFFTVYRPEGEYTILPSTWHETGISLWGRAGDWRYEAQLIAAPDAFQFSRDGWINKGTHSPFEYKVANKYAGVLRVDNYSIKGLRLGVSGFYGNTMHNTLPHDLEGNTANGTPKKYSSAKGKLAIGTFDFAYNDHNFIARGNLDYGYLSDAQTISIVKRNLASNNAPYDKTPVGKNAVAAGIEAGYDVFSPFAKLREDEQKLYVFARYDYYNSFIPGKNQPDQYKYTARQVITAGVNYMPIPQIKIKAQYAQRFFKTPFNDEPSVSLGVVYMGFFN